MWVPLLKTDNRRFLLEVFPLSLQCWASYQSEVVL